MSRKICHRRDLPRRSRPLRVERLEDRSLLAVAAFTIELREDLGGVPGEVIAANEVEVGDCFFVEILAQEFHPLYSGLHGVALNIAWDPAVLEEIDAGFALDQLITGNLPLFRDGTLDNAAGTIDNLSGSAFHATGIGRAIGNGTPERFALLHFRAENATAATSIQLSEGASSIVTQPAATFASSQLSFEEQSVAIAAAQPPIAATGLAEPQPEVVPQPEPPPNAPPEPPPEQPVEDIAPELPPDETADPGEPSADDALVFLFDAFQDPVEATTDIVSDDELVDETENPLAEPEPDVEIYTLGDSDADHATDCLADADFTAAVDLVLMGPLTPEQFAAQSADALSPHGLRLEDLIALLAIDATRRREATVLNAVNIACS